MTNQKKYYLLFIIVTLLPLFSITPKSYCASDDYKVGIAENSKVVWEVTNVDKDKLEQFLSSANLNEDDFDYKEDDKFIYEINSITEVSDKYYLISFNYYENDENKGPKSEKIAKDPKDMAEDWEDQSLDDYSVMFVLTDTKEYLKEFGNKISDTYKNLIYTTSSSIILNGTVGSFLFWLKMKYDKRGILEEFSLVYDSAELFKIELKNYSKTNELPFFLIIIGIIIVIIVIAAVIAVVVVLNKKAKVKRKAITTTPIVPPADVKTEDLTKAKGVSDAEIKKEPGKRENIYCENCGSKRELNAKFCPFCGNKFIE
jgi:hypothetical protein